mgnify:CR=1 FL=1
MQVRLTTEADLERVMEIYHGAQAFMAAHGNPTQWRNVYPTPEIVREDIALHRGYVCEQDGRLYAAFMLIIGIMRIQDYEFGKFVATTALSLATMLIIIFLLFLVFMLSQQIYGWLITVYTELKY